jgi:predicted ester cyclase
MSNKERVVSEANKAAMRDILRIFETGDLTGVESLIAPNAVDHQGMPGVDTNGVEGFKRLVTIMHTAYPDMHMHIEDLIAEGDKVVARTEMHGRNTGAFMDQPATNKEVEGKSIDIIRFENGLAVEHWGISNDLEMMQQLGLLPPM